jgi:hypothetical protein
MPRHKRRGLMGVPQDELTISSTHSSASLQNRAKAWAPDFLSLVVRSMCSDRRRRHAFLDLLADCYLF